MPSVFYFALVALGVVLSLLAFLVMTSQPNFEEPLPDFPVSMIRDEPLLTVEQSQAMHDGEKMVIDGKEVPDEYAYIDY